METINFALLLQAREAAVREPSPSAGIIDSQSVKTTESGGPRGYDVSTQYISKGNTLDVAGGDAENCKDR